MSSRPGDRQALDLQLYLELSPGVARATGDRSAQWRGRILVTPGPWVPPGVGLVSVLSLQASGRLHLVAAATHWGSAASRDAQAGTVLWRAQRPAGLSGPQRGAGPIGGLPPATAGTPVGEAGGGPRWGRPWRPRRPAAL